jgi:cell division protein FtsQ
MLGELDGYRAKLDKLQRFYLRGLSYEGWDTYRYINLKYKNQIVCTK